MDDSLKGLRRREHVPVSIDFWLIFVTAEFPGRSLCLLLSAVFSILARNSTGRVSPKWRVALLYRCEQVQKCAVTLYRYNQADISRSTWYWYLNSLWVCLYLTLRIAKQLARSYQVLPVVGRKAGRRPFVIPVLYCTYLYSKFRWNLQNPRRSVSLAKITGILVKDMQVSTHS
jgi:hypothetical protein